MTLALTMSLIIGLLLGLLGGGGSILTVPMLVYLLHIEPKQAIVTSFVVVGVSSLMALIPNIRRGRVCWKSGVVFGMAGMAGAFGGGQLAGHFPGDLLMGLFGLISLTAGLLMLRGSKSQAAKTATSKPLTVCPLKVPFLRVLFDGFFVGALTGMVGVGGGFLIVPTLTLLVGLPIQGAVGTSLLIIAMNALAGFIGYSQHVALDFNLTSIVTGGTLFGSAMGAWLSDFVKPTLLRRGFGIMVVLVAGYVLSQSVTVQLLTNAEQWMVNPRGLVWLMLGLLLLWLFLRISSWIHKAETLIKHS
jgi:hypothetical protein